MADDDLVPDEALVVRLEQAAGAISEVADLMSTRSHLPREEVTALKTRAFELVGEANAAAHPDDEINAKYRSRMRGEFLTTSTGLKFYPWDPKAEEVIHLDIIIGLVNEDRYNGQTSKPGSPHIPRPISVGEHSIKAAAIAEILCVRDGLDHRATLLACLHTLLHDAHEAYWGDIIRPIGARLFDVQTGKPLEHFKQACQDVILEAYRLGPLSVEADSIMHEADILAYTCEVMTARRQSLDEDNRALPVVTAEILEAGRISPEAPMRDVVLKLLDGEIRRLVGLVGGVVPGPQRAPLDAAEPTVDPSHALETLARMKQVPGDRGYERLGPESHDAKDAGYMPDLSRQARPGDMSEGSWKNAITSSDVGLPKALLAEIQEEMNNPETTELKRKVLSDEMNRLKGVSGD